MSWLRPIDRWFGENVFVYRDIHRRYARKLVGNDHEAEDIVQEAYARLFRLENWAQIANPHAFTMRILHNEAIERFRRAEVVWIDRGALLHALDPADEAPGPDVISMGRSELRRVALALETLPDRCREAVRLRRIEGFSPGEVAEKMQISVSTVEKHLTKGLRLLVEQMSEFDEQEQAGQNGEWDLKAHHDRK